MGKNEEKYVNLEGRGDDGWGYVLLLKSKDGGPPQVMEVSDHDGPEAVWARILEVQKKAKWEKKGTGEVPAPVHTHIVFSGARTTAQGKIDGFTILDYETVCQIIGLRNKGAASVGGSEARIAALEAGLANMGERMAEAEAALDDLEGDPEPDQVPGVASVAAPTEAVKSAISAAGAEDEE